ncbi:hypothetical protein [Clostridium lundense]|uniref:hypothetical protein n=1 Tax=Clostridium lundense TaxID=319475 RepID=UPI000687620B|nr:hypothetical protein [Clostridium lundense]
MEKPYKNFYKLCLGWFIILSIYLLIVFIVISGGFLRAKNVLGILLLVFPYTVGALYYLFFCRGKSKTFYALGFFVPSITEKIIIYLLSAYIFDINPLYITSVMQITTDEGSHMRQGINGIGTYYPYVFSFFSWSYVVVGVLIPIIMTIFIVRLQKNVDL